MGLTLTNEQIDLTYPGLIKTSDNAGITGVFKPLSDGVGINLPIEMSTVGVNFTGTADFTNATVTGITSGGLIAGSGADSMASAAFLTPNPRVASGDQSIAIGNAATASGAEAIAIGDSVTAGGIKNIAIGTGKAVGVDTIVIGGADATSAAARTIAIGNNYPIDLSYRGDSVSVGHGIYPSLQGTFIGHNAYHTLGGATHCVAIGNAATTSANQSISLGALSVSTATQSVAIGYGVTAATANTVTLKKLQMLDYATLSFADDAAASTGGIPLGGVYHTAGALKIRIV